VELEGHLSAGLGTLSSYSAPKDQKPQKLPFTFPFPVVSLAAGWGHTLVLTRDKTVFVWGCNKGGQFGLGDFTNHDVPTCFVLPNNLLVKFIAAERDSSMVVLEDGSLWSRMSNVL
jgi:NIMA (never in mitosis gene a)-related kinase